MIVMPTDLDNMNAKKVVQTRELADQLKLLVVRIGEPSDAALEDNLEKLVSALLGMEAEFLVNTIFEWYEVELGHNVSLVCYINLGRRLFMVV